MLIRVAETIDFSPKVLNELKKLGKVEFCELRKGETLAEVFQKYDVFWFRLKYQITQEILSINNRKVQYIVTPVTGLDHIDTTTCDKLGIHVISLKGENEFLKQVRATAEHCLLLTLALIRHICPANAHVKEGKWKRDSFKGSEIYQKKVGIIGFGRLGRIVAKYFYAMGAIVIANDISKTIQYPHYVKNVSIDELLTQADIVSLHIDNSEKNEMFFNQQRIKKMKKSSIFINTSRGNLVDEQVLIKALQAGNVAGIALDVVKDEYNLTQSPAIEYLQQYQPDNLIITPHIGGNTYESFEKTEDFILKKLTKQIKTI